MALPTGLCDREKDKFFENSSGQTTVRVGGSVALEGDGLGVNIYGTVSSVATSTTVTLVTYTVPVGKCFFLENVEVAGENIANYEVQVDGSPIAKKRMWFGGPISGAFDFKSSLFAPIKYAASQVIRVRVENFRPSTANFEGRIQGVERDA